MHAVILHEKDNDCKNYTKTYSKIISVLLELKSTYENLEITKNSLKSCMGCLDCWLKTPGECVINDFGRIFASKVINSDLFIILTPIVFGNYSNTIKRALERLISNLHPYFELINGETHHKRRYNKYPIVIPIGILNESNLEEERLFRALIKRNLINLYSEGSKEIIISSENQVIEIENILTFTLLNKNRMGVLV